MTLAVYRLDSMSDNPTFGTFFFSDEASLTGQENIYDDFEETSPSLAKRWTPRKVTGDARRGNDYAPVYTVPALSQRAADALRELLEANGELLALVTPPKLGTYYAYHLTTVVDALDQKKSDVSSFVEVDHHYAFRKDQLAKRSIFKIPELTGTVFVTDAFVDRVKERGLQGFNFRKVWPLPPGVEWFRSEKVQKRQAAATCASKQSPKGAVKKVTKRRPSKAKGSSPEALKVHAEEPAPGKERKSVDSAIAGYEAQLGIDAGSMRNDEIQAWIGGTLEKLRGNKRMKKEQKEDRAFWLAIAWGETLVQQLKWRWVVLRSAKDAKTLGLISPNRLYAVPVLQYMTDLAMGIRADQTSELLFNMIVKNDLGPRSKGGLTLIS